MKIINNYNEFINEAAVQDQLFTEPQPQTDVQPSTELSTEPSTENPIQDDLTAIKKDSNVISLDKINKIIDYTAIRPDLIKENVKDVVNDAIENDFYAIVVNPEFVDYVVYEIEDNDIKVISTIDFPEGKMNSTERLNEVVKVISDGADEIDLSIDIEDFKKGYSNDNDDIKSSTYLSIEKDIKKIADECHKNGVVLKVIVESGILSFGELKDICQIVAKSNVDYVQTSSGTKEIGAELDKIKEIRRILPEHVKICAAGGIRSLEEANKFYPYVDRIGTSQILK